MLLPCAPTNAANTTPLYTHAQHTQHCSTNSMRPGCQPRRSRLPEPSRHPDAASPLTPPLRDAELL